MHLDQFLPAEELLEQERRMGGILAHCFQAAWDCLLLFDASRYVNELCRSVRGLDTTRNRDRLCDILATAPEMNFNLMGGLVVLLYPVCRWFAYPKQRGHSRWWAYL